MNDEKKNEDRKYEFCEACRLNHNQGVRHVYFPRHKSAISALLTRFQSRLADVNSFLKHPMPLQHDISHQNRFWCLFCNCEVLEHDSEFTCGNAIRHFASGDHWKKVKEFMWKNRTGKDRVDASFRIASVDFEKWEKKINSIRNDNVKPEPNGALLVEQMNNIHNETNAEFARASHEANVQPLSFNFKNNVLPLQMNTNEKAQVSHSEASFVCETALSTHSLPGLAQEGTAKFLKMSPGSFYNHRFADSDVAHPSIGSKVFYRETADNGDGSAQGFINLTRIIHREETIVGNVHTGATPPWFDQPDNKQTAVICHSIASKRGKSSKLNPKRVGAAWAERRKLEIDLENKGELAATDYDPNWLPNFGSVWNSGTRKDSRKQFQMETDCKSANSLPLHPYIGKRKRMGDNKSP